MHVDLTVQYAVDRVGLPDADAFERWARAALEDNEHSGSFSDGTTSAAGDGDGTMLSLTLRVVDAAESASLNQRYRGKPGPTNVLSFPLDAPPLSPDVPAGTRPVLYGDIALCAPVIAAEAVTQRKAPAAHWAHLVVHGVLHLLGYDHHRDADADRMERREATVLAGLGYPDPYRAGPP